MLILPFARYWYNRRQGKPKILLEKKVMVERRRLERRHILFYSRVFDRKTGVFLGYLGNMNAGGMMIISEDPMEIDCHYLLRIDLPDENYALPVLNFEAKSVWCKKDIDPNFYNTGFRFEEISEENKQIIEQITIDYGFRE
jgi:hypothetical protein